MLTCHNHDDVSSKLDVLYHVATSSMKVYYNSLMFEKGTLKSKNTACKHNNVPGIDLVKSICIINFVEI